MAARPSKPFGRLLWVTGLSLALLFAAGDVCTQTTGSGSRDVDAERVHFGDVLEVDVVGSFEYDWRGSLNMDGYLAGYDAYDVPILAICRKEPEIAADIAKSLSKFLRSPVVNVRIIDRSGRALARVEGAVRNPARFMIRRPVHLRELLVLTGGISEGADGSIRILRRADLGCTEPNGDNDGSASARRGNGSEVLNITVSELLKGDENADPEIKPGDLVTVAKAQPVYMIGGVSNLSPLYVRSEISVTRAIAMAGGLVKNADPSRVVVYRRQGVETKVLDLDLGKIGKGDQKDEILQPFDILEVALKGGEKRRFPPAAPSNALKVTSGELPLRVVE